MTMTERKGETPVKRFRIPRDVMDQIEALRLPGQTLTDVVVDALRLGLRAIARRKAHRGDV